MDRLITVAALAALASLPAAAQQSVNFKLEEHAFNSGGGLADSERPASANFAISLHAVGASTVAEGLSSPSHSMDASFAWLFPPPGEVRNLRVYGPSEAGPSAHDLSWDAERSAGTYNLYRDLLGALSGLQFGQCEQTALTVPVTSDSGTPPPGDGFFYLVTAANRLAEEGIKGVSSDGAERAGSTCP